MLKVERMGEDKREYAPSSSRGVKRTGRGSDGEEPTTKDRRGDSKRYRSGSRSRSRSKGRGERSSRRYESDSGRRRSDRDERDRTRGGDRYSNRGDRDYDDRRRDRDREQERRDRDRRDRKGTPPSRSRMDEEKPSDSIANDNVEDYKKKVEEELQGSVSKVEETEEELRLKRLLRRQAIMAKYQQPTSPSQDQQPAVAEPATSSSTTTSVGKEEGTSAPSPPVPTMVVSNTKIFDDDGLLNEPSPMVPEVQDLPTTAQETTKKEDTSTGFDMFSDSEIVPESLEVRTFEGVELKTDGDGYYCPRLGEVLGSKYRVISTYGRGVFSTVVRAYDVTGEEEGAERREVAIKVVRMNDMMKTQGRKEVEMLRLLQGQSVPRTAKDEIASAPVEAAPPVNNCCVRLLDAFEDRGLLCMVFEPMAYTLRQVTKRFGRDQGLAIKGVRYYMKCMLIALYHLKRGGILHADIKPDNILVSESTTVCQLADFGCASPVEQNDPTPMLGSRWYRAPESILGVPYGHPFDMWSLGCVLYEVATGRVLFKGDSNNEMLRMQQEAKGRFAKKMISRGLFAAEHFDLATGKFLLVATDESTKQPYLREVVFDKPTRSLKAEILTAFSGETDQAQVLQLHDLLEQMLVLDPQKRITPEEALRHPFFQPLAQQ